jgi:HEAT repeat protein
VIADLGSDDFNVRARALATLVAQGRAAVPELTEALRTGDERVRPQAAQALAEVVDPGSAETFAAVLEDPLAEVRGQAAVGLARLGDPRAPDALAATLDDLPDLLHYPYTGAVYALIDLGRPALPAVVPLLSADNPETRRRAALVIGSVLGAEALGDYDPDASADAREAATPHVREAVARSR